MLFRLEDTGRYGRPTVYTIDEKLSTPIIAGLEIDLNEVFIE